MQIKIDWQEPIQLTQNRRLLIEDVSDLTLEAWPGVYFFSRKFGQRYEPFYIGETMNLRTRLKQHLKSVDIVDALRGEKKLKVERIRQGNRYFHFGYLNYNGQDHKKRLSIVQRHMIRHAVEGGYALVNKNLKSIPSHSLIFTGSQTARAIYEKQITVEAD